MDAIDLFAGWGGFTLGATQAGVNVVWAANHSPVAVRTHALNHPGTVHACQDLRQADWTALPNYQILLASPACQGHSTASQPRRRVFHDAMRATAFAVIDCADVTEPELVVVENVRAFTKWRLYGDWVRMLRRLGYHVTPRVINAADHGVAQRRPRLFIVASKKRLRLPELPKVPELPFEPLLENLEDHPELWRPVASATPGVRERIARGRARHGRRFLTQHVTGHPGVPLHEPIRTITTAPAHWNLVDGDRYRALTGRELARGTGFPDSFRWPSDLSAAQVTRGIGNAVCPPVARQLVGQLADAIS